MPAAMSTFGLHPSSRSISEMSALDLATSKGRGAPNAGAPGDRTDSTGPGPQIQRQVGEAPVGRAILLSGIREKTGKCGGGRRQKDPGMGTGPHARNLVGVGDEIRQFHPYARPQGNLASSDRGLDLWKHRGTVPVYAIPTTL